MIRLNKLVNIYRVFKEKKVLHYLLLAVDVVVCVSLEVLSLALHHMYNTTPGRMPVVCGSWIRWLVSRIGSGADKLGGDWEEDEVQRTAKHYAIMAVTAKMLG